MRNELPEKPGIEERIRSLGADQFPQPDAEACEECGDAACAHPGVLYSGGTEPPILPAPPR
ncbi:hypothetical protein GCM10017687_12350 [Streptomyces echinatus]|uniref:Uncharacterized protein n=1 Tax=Streptomyces echinatus TaxID=67293 RepID=A0A7W9UUC9_9ACTN|nr:hypothetical protein [Streptomyces echinatus]